MTDGFGGMNRMDSRNNKPRGSRKIQKYIKMLVVLIVIFGAVMVYTNTQGFKRQWHSVESNVSGLKREVAAYDSVGNLLFYHVGKFDVDYTAERILYDDEKGLRHVVYFKGGNAFVNELPRDGSVDDAVYLKDRPEK